MFRIASGHFYNIFHRDNPLLTLSDYLPSPKYSHPQVLHFPLHRLREYYDPTTIPYTPAVPVPCIVPSIHRFRQIYLRSGSDTCFLPVGSTEMPPAWNHRILLPFHPTLFPRQVSMPVPFPEAFHPTILRFRKGCHIHGFHVRYHHTAESSSPRNHENITNARQDPDDMRSRYPIQQPLQALTAKLRYIFVPVPVPAP